MLRIPFVLLQNIYRALKWAVARAIYALVMAFEKRRRYVTLKLEGDYPFGGAKGLAGLFKSETTFHDLRRDIKQLAEDDDVVGVVVEVGEAELGAARNAQLIADLDRLRSGGKHVVSHGDMLLVRDYLQATVADDMLVTPAGRLYTFGPRFENYFLAGAFQKYGIDAQFIHIGGFKTAANRFVKAGMSTTERLMLSGLRDNLAAQWLGRVTSRRRLPTEQAETLFRDAPLDPRNATRNSLVDAEVFAEDIEEWLEAPGEHVHFPEARPDEKPAVRLLSRDEWDSARPGPLVWRPLLRRKKSIAIVDLAGMIITPGMSVPGTSLVIDPSKVIPVLGRIAKDRRIAGVILHINSPGGSALASDLIWKAVSDLRREKPVVAYCSDIAASGGYYIAVGADRIVCHPETVTGSIGVSVGKMSAGGALRRIGVNADAVHGDDGSEFLSLFSPLSPRTFDNLREDARSFYRRFLQRVGQARHIERRRLHRFARGRVYMGDEALQRKLVDDVGGYDAALRLVVDLCRKDGSQLSDDPPTQFFAHREQSLKSMLRSSAVHASGLASLAPVAEPLIVAELMRRDPTLALLPWRLQS